MEIVLSDKQNKIIQAALSEQEQLRNLYVAEVNKIQKTIDSVVATILDIHNQEPVEGIQYKDGKLILPEKENEVEPAKVEVTKKEKKK